MREKLLDFLRCPFCHGSLALTAGRREGAQIGRASCRERVFGLV
jgi:uncharacterized protein YbaR (Trm112 family)